MKLKFRKENVNVINLKGIHNIFEAGLNLIEIKVLTLSY